MGNSNLRRSQLGIETTPYMAVAADVQLAGKLSMKHNPNRTLREEARASMGGSNVRDDLLLESTGTYAGRCTAAELVYFLSMSLRSDPTVTTPGTGARKSVYAQPLTTTPIPDVLYATMYWGDDSGALRAPGVVVTQIVIEGADEGAWTIRCTLLGGGVIAGTFASLSTITNESVKNLLTRLFITSSWSALDATVVGDALTQLAYGFTWTWDSGINPDPTMSGALSLSAISRDLPRTTLQLRTKWSGNALTQAVNWINGTRQFIRLQNEGSLIASSGAKNTIQIDGAYDFVDFDSVADERNGVTRATWDLEAVEDTSRKVEVTVINAVIPPL